MQMRDGGERERKAYGRLAGSGRRAVHTEGAMGRGETTQKSEEGKERIGFIGKSLKREKMSKRREYEPTDHHPHTVCN